MSNIFTSAVRVFAKPGRPLTRAVSEEILAAMRADNGSYWARYLRTMQVTGAVPTRGPEPPTTRTLVRWLMSPPDRLDEDQQRQLKAARQACPHLDALCGHIRAFARILTNRQGAATLRDWAFAAKTDDLPALKTFATGLDRDWSAIVAGVTLPWSSGMVESSVIGQTQQHNRPSCPRLCRDVDLHGPRIRQAHCVLEAGVRHPGAAHCPRDTPERLRSAGKSST